MTRGDKALLVTVLAVCALLVVVPSAVLVAAPADESGRWVLLHAPGETSVLSLATDGDHTVEGHLGPVTVEVRDGEARIVDSPCPEQRCVSAGAVAGRGTAAVCVPGGIVLEPRTGEGYDGVVR
jgi:hypothetical protein